MGNRAIGGVARLAGPLHERLLLWVPVAALAGVLLPRVASALDGLVPVFLAGQVLGVAVTLTVAQLAPVWRRPGLLAVALGAQWLVMPLVGAGLAALDPGVVGRGVLIVAVAPAEVTSALVAVVAGGDGALATTLMAASLAIGCVATPLWLVALVGPGLKVPEQGLLLELAFSVLVPLGVGVAARARWPSLGQYRLRALDLAALSLVMVVFVGAGRARGVLGSLSVLPATGLCLALVVVGLGLGTAVARALGLGYGPRQAVIFGVGMREFGVATAVALAVAPASAGLGGLYGVLLMLCSSGLAMRLRRGRREAGREG